MRRKSNVLEGSEDVKITKNTVNDEKKKIWKM